MKKIIILSLLTLSFTACKKEKYEGHQSFWFDGMTSGNLQQMADVTTLTLYIDEEFVSTVDVDDYKLSAPACKEGQFLFTDKMYKKETAKHKFKVVDQTNQVFWDGTITTEAGACNIVRLSF